MKLDDFFDFVAMFSIIWLPLLYIYLFVGF